MARGFNSGNKQEEELPKPKLNKELFKKAAQILPSTFGCYDRRRGRKTNL